MAIVAIAAIAIPSTASAATPVAGHVRVAIDSAAHDASYAATPARSQYVILQAWEGARMRALKAANPSLKVLVYQNLSAMRPRDQWGNLSTGVSTQEADQHPEWYLVNTSGQRFTFWGHSTMYAADIGNADYQQRWADNVLAVLQNGGWDGVFVDDVNPTMRYHYDVASVAKYPSDAQYGQATGSALAAIGPRLRAAGKLVVANFGDWRHYRSVVDPWLQYVSGGMDEMFTKWSATAGQGYITGDDWERQLGALENAQRQGKTFLAITHSPATDDAAALYGWGTVLLGASGNAAFALQQDYTNETWFPEYDYPIGAPLAAETRDASGVHRRAFGNGLVLVNPTTAGVRVSFGGSYSGSGVSHATGATMGPHSALILVKDPAAGVQSPAATPTPAPSPAATPKPPPAGGGAAKPKAHPRARIALLPHKRSPRRVHRRLHVRVRCAAAHGRSCRKRIEVRLRHGSSRARMVGRRIVRVAGGRHRVVSVRLHGRRAARAHRSWLSVRVRRLA